MTTQLAMEALISGIQDALISHCQALGVFGRVNGHEPKSRPGGGSRPSAAVWLDFVAPSRTDSGLNVTSMRMTWTVRVFLDFVAKPEDTIDVRIASSAAALIGSLSEEFTLAGLIEQIDFFGRESEGLQAQAGYLQQDNRLMRVMTVSIPMIVSNVWIQGE